MAEPDAASDQTRHSPPRAASETLRDGATGAWAAGDSAFQAGAPVRIGKFEVRTLLGEGAFGRVYRAFDLELEREVAVKVPHADGLTATFRDRFLREARAAATIHHANVCPVYEVGTDGELPYLVMHFVRGTTLDAVLSRLSEPMPPRNAVAIARKLALGIAAAHAQGVVHRDLKPQNVLYDEASREVLITDFGLARIGGEARMTADGAVFGTPAYMSPEQARGKVDEVGPLSDVYSLGVILYRMLTGELPFTGTVFEIMVQHWETPPRPASSVRPGLDPRLDAICLKALAKNPAERYYSAKAFAAALGNYLRGSETLELNGSAEAETVKEPAAEPRRAVAPPAAVRVPPPEAPKLARPVPPPPPAAPREARPVARRPLATRPDDLAPAMPLRDKLLWAALGLLLLAGTLAGLVLSLGQKAPDATRQPPAPPADAGATANESEPPPPAPKPPDRFAGHTFDQAAERRAAEWVLSLGTVVSKPELCVATRDSDAKKVVTTAAELPAEFVVREITFEFGHHVPDDELRARLAGLSGPISLVFRNGEHLRDETLKVAARIPGLRELRLDYAPFVTDAGLAPLAGHPALRTVRLDHTAITPAAVARTVRTLPALKELSLGEALATDEVLAELKAVPTLETLLLPRVWAIYKDLEPSLLTKAGVARLAEVKGLKHLDLHGHPVEDDWLPPLYALPLQSIQLYDTKVTPDARRALREALPKCDIIPDPPDE